MSERDRRDVSAELRSAADVQLTKDYTAYAWAQGQRRRRRTGWAVGAGLAASAAAAAFVASQTLGPLTSAPPLDPAVPPTATSGPVQTSDAEPAPSTDPDGDASTGQPSKTDPEAAAPESTTIPLGNGVVLEPLEGWRLVHDRDLAAGADPEYVKTGEPFIMDMNDETPVRLRL
ncbi:MAG: hypothetical protein H0U62_03460 [Actinobacteria bacterium]|nr:hypothetical protein [Actinomycetota bacterium]